MGYRNFEDCFQESKNRGCKVNLLLGNGFSIDISEGNLRYTTLYEESKLSDDIKKIFKHLSTCNFEEVMESLSNAMAILKVIDKEKCFSSKEYEEKYRNPIEKKLIETLVNLHPNRNNINKNHIEFIKKFNVIFTTNYDLLLYWITREIDDGKNAKNCQFKDGFSRRYNYKNELYWNPYSHNAPNLLYLHGALHLKNHCGNKLKYDMDNKEGILDQITKNIKTRIYPHIILEGTHEQKEKSIENSQYLSHCLRKLSNIKGDLFIHGSSLGKNDSHIWNIINKNTDIQNIYISIHENDKQNVKGNSKEIFKNKKRDFYNSNI